VILGEAPAEALAGVELVDEVVDDIGAVFGLILVKLSEGVKAGCDCCVCGWQEVSDMCDGKLAEQLSWKVEEQRRQRR
jgi:hypothetical protein